MARTLVHPWSRSGHRRGPVGRSRRQPRRGARARAIAAGLRWRWVLAGCAIGLLAVVALLTPALLGLWRERDLPGFEAMAAAGFLLAALAARAVRAADQVELLLAAAGSHLVAGLVLALLELPAATGLLLAFLGLVPAALGSLCCWYRYLRDQELPPHIEDVFD